MSVVDFGHVRPREEPVLLCWIVTLGEIVEHTYGMIIITPLWCWTFPKDGVFGVVYWHLNMTSVSQLQVFQSTVKNTSPNTDRAVIPILSEESIRNDALLVVMNFTALACRRYLKINMTSLFTLLTEIEVFDTGKSTHKHQKLH